MNYGMKHPAGFDPGAERLWFGPEVENDRKGLWTAFVTGRLDGAQIGRVEKDAQHVFLLEQFNDFRWFEDCLALRCARKPITLARIAHPAAIKAATTWRNGLTGLKVRIVVRVEAPWMTALAPDDEVSCGMRYSLWTWTVEDAIRARPKDYKEDAP